AAAHNGGRHDRWCSPAIADTSDCSPQHLERKSRVVETYFGPTTGSRNHRHFTSSPDFRAATILWPLSSSSAWLLESTKPSVPNFSIRERSKRNAFTSSALAGSTDSSLLRL